MKSPARVHERHVERPAVERHQQRCTLEDLTNGRKLRVLARGTRQEELADLEAALLEPTTARKKCNRAGSPAEAGGLDVEEHHAIGPVAVRLEPVIEQMQRLVG